MTAARMGKINLSPFFAVADRGRQRRALRAGGGVDGAGAEGRGEQAVFRYAFQIDLFFRGALGGVMHAEIPFIPLLVSKR